MAQGVAFMTVLDLQQTARETGDSAAKAWLRALAATAPIAVHPQRTLPAVIEELGRHYGEAPALVSAHESFTYAQLAERANRYARWALALGLAKRDTVCLLMPNRPEYLAIWLGLTSAGVVVALINTELRRQSLALNVMPVRLHLAPCKFGGLRRVRALRPDRARCLAGHARSRAAARLPARSTPEKD